MVGRRYNPQLNTKFLQDHLNFKKLQMHLTKCRSTTIVALCVVMALVSAQVTFSRDWSGGKRSPPAVLDCSQFARLCRHFVHELKEGMTEDKLSRHRRVELEDIPNTYEDDK